ncbi:MAG: ABC transporter permease [Patescibacteria group bacterium]|jgi:putative ABC transport system permease protein
MKLILRNLLRRKLRTVLTVGGIVIGVFALTVMGAMSEKLSLLVKGGEDYYGTKVLVVDGQSSAFFGGAPLTMDKRAELEKVDGVTYVSADVSLLLDDETGATFGTPAMIVSYDPAAEPYESFELNTATGRFITAEDRNKTVLGADLADTLKTDVGQTIKLRERDFEVVGILEKTLTAPDNTAIVSLADAQEFVHSTLPDAFKESLPSEKVVSSFAVYLDDIDQGEAVAERINDQVEGVKRTARPFSKSKSAKAWQFSI